MKKHTVLLQVDEEKAEELSIADFEEVMGIRYCPHLYFENPKHEKTIRRQTEKYLQSGDVASSLRLGRLFHHHIHMGHVQKMLIKWIDDEIGFGAFAVDDILPGTYLAEYSGAVKLRGYFYDYTNPYCFSYPTASRFWRKFTIDAKEHGNEARFLNHSDTPNSVAQSAYVDGLMHIILRSELLIRAGEELTYSYGDDYWKHVKKRL